MCSVVVVVGGLGFEDKKAGACVESYVYQLICAHAQRSPCLGFRIQYSYLRWIL